LKILEISVNISASFGIGARKSTAIQNTQNSFRLKNHNLWGGALFSPTLRRGHPPSQSELHNGVSAVSAQTDNCTETKPHNRTKMCLELLMCSVFQPFLCKNFDCSRSKWAVS